MKQESKDYCTALRLTYSTYILNQKSPYRSKCTLTIWAIGTNWQMYIPSSSILNTKWIPPNTKYTLPKTEVQTIHGIDPVLDKFISRNIHFHKYSVPQIFISRNILFHKYSVPQIFISTNIQYHKYSGLILFWNEHPT